MDLNQLWQEYKELILVIATALATLVATLLGQKILPGLWKAMGRLWEKLRASLGKRLSAAEFERRYLEQLCEEQRFLKVRGIRTRSPVAVELEKVYVSLTLNRPSRDRPDARAEMEAMLEEALPEGVRPEPVRRPEARAEEPERLPVGEALQRCPERLVILGGPGTGKTTLVSYLALKFARGQAEEKLGLDEERLPILIPLRELPRTGLSLTAENLPALSTAPERAKECPEGFFKKRLEDGDCIVLLDGMDEVTTEDERRWVAEQIDDFVTTYKDNRFIVTSRPAGYSGVALAGFTQLDVSDFTDEDVEAFARYWCLAVELAVRGIEREISEAVARRKAEREAEELVAAIRANDRVRRLTVNPLLLTIVAMVHRYRATLPNRRVELYDECTEVLLGYWDQAKGIAGQLDWASKRRVLEPLAYWMHQQGLREAERAQVEQVIASALPTVGEKEASAAEFLKSVRERSGLLMERGLGIYGFSHLTFQEYLTASYLIDRGEEGREELLKHLYDPWWLEVTLLYAGMRDATPLIEAILAQRDDLFKNNLFLSARCLIDRLNIDPRVEDEVLSWLMEEFQAGEFQGLHNRASKALIELGSSPSAPKVVEGLLRMLGDEEAEVRWSAASALGELGRAETGVVEALVGLLGDQHEIVRWSAASALGELGRAEAGVIEALLNRLGDEHETVRRHAARALGWLGRAEPRVIEALLGLLGDEHGIVQRSAASTLGWLGRAEPRVVEVLLDRLGDKHETVRWSAASALGRLGRAEPRVVEVLLDRLGDKHETVRQHAADALGALEQAKPEVVKALMSRLSDEHETVRWSAASALGRLGRAEPGVVEALLSRMGDEDASMRGGAADALGELGRAKPEVVEALLGLLGDEEASVRESAASALGELGRAEPRVVEALLGRLGDKDGNVRWQAAYALGQLGRAEPGVVEALLGLLSDEEAEVRWSAAFALGQLERAEPGVIEALVGLLGDKDEYVRGSASDALGRLGQAEPGVVEALLDRLGDEKADVRWYAADALNQLGQAELGMVEALLQRLGDEDGNVRGSAAYALDPRMRPPGQRIPQMVPQDLQTLGNLLKDEREVEYPFAGIRSKVKDVAWWLLQRYSEDKGERIYRHDGGEEQ